MTKKTILPLQLLVAPDKNDPAPLILYHGRNCPDGFGAALAAWLYYGDQAEYVGLDHGQVGGPSAALLAGTRLTGMVLGVRGAVGNGYGAWSYDVFVGRPVSQPEAFPDKSTNGGFQLSWTY